MPAVTYTLQEKRNTVTAWAKSGMTVEAFCKENGVNRSTMYIWVRDKNINRTGKMPMVRGGGRKLSPEDVEKILELRSQKQSYADIASKFGVSDGRIGQLCREHPELDFYHKGGAISRTIDLPALDEPSSEIKEAFSTRPFEHLAETMKEADIMVNDSRVAEVTKSTALKLSTIQVKGETTGFRYNVGERLMINNFTVELDDIQSFIDELQQVQKLVDAVRG